MELKLGLGNGLTGISVLLIVPYGIETRSKCGRYNPASGLLIVPYGIETIKHKLLERL